jgi:hypothetical protein
MLPGLLFGAASIAKEQGLFGGGLTDAEKAGNNAGWANMGHGRLPDGSINPMLMHEPMKLPGASLPTPAEPTPGLSLAGAAPRRVSAIPIDIRAPQQAPQPQQWAPPQAPVVGLLSDPNEQQRRAFFQSQGIGPAAQFAMR